MFALSNTEDNENKNQNLNLYAYDNNRKCTSSKLFDGSPH